MFSFAPEMREFEVVSQLPDRLRKKKRSAWADLNLGAVELDAFLEGPAFDAEGDLFLVDVAFGRILSLAKDGTWSVVTEYDGWPNGLKLLDSNSFLVADNKLGLIKIERHSGKVSVIRSEYDGVPFQGLNDLTISSDGDIYFTDQGRSGLHDPSGRLFRLTRSGDLQLVTSSIPSPNGLVLSTDERTLFLAVTRANAIWRVPLGKDGAAYKVGTFVQLSGGIGPDGLARLPGEDSFLVAHPGLGVWQFRPNGTPRRLWRRDGFDYPTNLAHCPTRPNVFYVTESKRAAVLQISIDRPSNRHHHEERA